MARLRAATVLRTLEVRRPEALSWLATSTVSTAKKSIDYSRFEASSSRIRITQPPAWLLYLILLGLQLRIIWGDWVSRDLTGGDTSSYFRSAYAWYQHFGVNILWSPLYTAFYGTFLVFSQDAFFATYVHRIVILIAVDALWFALVRALLPWPVACLLALWWIHLTSVFNVYYEVHLFVLIPVLLALLIAARSRGPNLRALALAFLLLAGSLVRPEYFVAAATVVVASCIGEGWRIRRLPAGSPRFTALAVTLRGYAVALIMVCLATGFFYWRSDIKFPELSQALHDRNTLQVCQAYGVVYKQRHPEWPENPWVACHQLVQDTFGSAEVTYIDAIRANPGAMLEHFGWNLSMVPPALQVALFNATQFSRNPNVFPVPTKETSAFVLTLLMVTILVAGGVALWRDRDFWYTWLRPRSWGWVALVACAATAAAITLPVWPFAEYTFGFTLLVMAACGLCLAALIARVPAGATCAVLVGAGIAVTTAIIPGQYDGNQTISSRPVLTSYERLRPFADVIAATPGTFVTDLVPGEMQSFLTYGNVPTVDYSLLAGRERGVALDQFLSEAGVSLIYVDSYLLDQLKDDPGAQALLTSPVSVGWYLVGEQNSASDHWRLLARAVNSGKTSSVRPQ